MTISVDGPEAFDTARHNPNRGWTFGPPGRSATERLRSGDFFEMRLKPKFALPRGAPVFTMGSCFAREVENTLEVLRIPLALQGHGIPPEEFESWNPVTGRGGGMPRGTLSRGGFNKYTVHSMSHELRRVLLNEEYEHDGLLELEDGRWFDPHASGLKAGHYDHVAGLRRRIHVAMSQVKRAKIVFLTLGLVEGWVDVYTGLGMNQLPSGRSLVKLASRFAFTVPSYSEIVGELVSTIELVRARCNPDMHFVLTVSPVPLTATFRDMDVIEANTASKATLRAAADEVASRFAFVAYFPSFELVMHTPRHLAFKEDEVHVRPEMVDHVMRCFTGAYLKEAVAA